jgi:Protein of unknown function (DUF3592)
MSTPRWMRAPFLIAFLAILLGFVLARWARGWGLLVVGGGILAVAVLYLVSQRQFLKRAHRTEGTVIAHDRKFFRDKYGRDREIFYPIVRYTLPDGQEVTFRGNSSIPLRSLPVSKNVSVLYDPLSPEHAIINNALEKLGGFCVAMILALSVLALGCLTLMGRV